MRSAGSKGVADLALAHPTHGLALVQVGTNNKTIGPDARREFLRIATYAGAIPLAALHTPRAGFTIHMVTAGPATRWPTFNITEGLTT